MNDITDKIQSSYPYLSKAEVNKIQQFAGDNVMKNAVKKLVLEEVYYNGTLQEPDSLKNFAILFAQQANQWGWDEEKLGKRIQAASEGIQLIEKGFARVDGFEKPEETEVKSENPGK